MKKISLLLPTRNQPLLIEKLFNDLVETASNLNHIEVILGLDRDDEESHKIFHPLLFIDKVIKPKGNGMGTLFRACHEKAQGDYVMLINDDVIFRTKGWDHKIIDAFSRIEDGICLIYGNDLYYGGRVSTFPAMSRKTCEMMGEICPPEYKSHSIDSHIFDIFQRLERIGHKRIIYLPDVILEHMNYGVTLASYNGYNNNNFLNTDIKQDRNLYISLGQRRQEIAIKLAKYIESYIQSPPTPPKPSVSVVISVSDDSLADGLSCVNTIYNDNRNNSLLLEVIMVYIGRKDKLPASFNKLLTEKIKIISCKEIGITKAFNKGASIASGDHLIFLDEGCSPTAGWLTALVEAAADEKVGAVGSKLLNPRNGRIEHIGISFFKDNGVIKNTNIYKGLLPTHPAVNRRREFQAVTMKGALVKKELFLKAKGFDENLSGAEDIDLCLKIRNLGRKVIYSPDTSLYYYSQLTKETSKVYIDNITSFLIKMKDKISCDLEDLLNEDGFMLSRKEERFYIAASSKRARELV